MPARTLVEGIGRVALDLVFPPRCGSCGRWGSFLCLDCEARLVPAHPPRCLRCWRPENGGACDRHEPALDGIRAAFVYEGSARVLVHALKYRGLTALAAPMAVLMASDLAEHHFEVDAVLPVPLTPSRQRSRGHNQAAALAEPLAGTIGAEYLPRSMVRRGKALAQARSASADERRRNVAGAFVVRQPELISGRRILVIDDVTTTGATLAACAVELRKAGAAAVWGLAFARED